MRFDQMKINFRGLSLVRTIIILSAVWYFAPASPAISAEVVDRIVAVVNEDIIRLTELNARLSTEADQIRSEGYPPEKEKQVLFDARSRILDEMINEILADQKIAEAGIQIDDQDVDATVERVKTMNRYTEEDLKQALQMRGMSMEKYRQEIRKQILRSKLVNQKVKSAIVITDSDIRAYYEAHPEEFGGKKKYTLRNIVMAYPNPDESRDRNQVRAEMEEVRHQLQGGASFAEIAKTRSQAPNAREGGELGQFALSEMSEQLRPVIGALQTGQSSDIIETDLGFQIFYVEAISDAPEQSFDTVRADIEKKLYDQAVDKKFDAWIKSMREAAHIKIIQ